MVVGGNPSFGKSEIYDLSGKNQNCSSISDHPVDYSSVGTFINNKPMVCGGADPITSDCYSYNIQVSLKYFFINNITYLWRANIFRILFRLLFFQNATKTITICHKTKIKKTTLAKKTWIIAMLKIQIAN